MFKLNASLTANDLITILEENESHRLFIAADLSRNNLHTIFNIFPSNFRNLLYLILNDCEIKIINSNTFENLPLLQYLDLSRNSIESLNEDLFVENRKLTCLSLSYNEIRNVPKYFIANIISLEELQLSSNKIERFSRIESLKLIIINLNDNKITKFEKNRFPELVGLYLNNNQLKKLSKLTFQSIPNLKILLLNENEIEQFQVDTFTSLRNLEYLSVANNNLQVITDNDFQSNIGLKTLYLSENRISDIAKNAFKQLLKLESLYLNYNKLTVISSVIFYGLDQLNYLDLSDNEIKDIDRLSFENMALLNIFCLNNNRSHFVIEKELFSFQNHLVHLDMSHSKIIEIRNKAFENLKQIELLNLSYNYIEELPDYFLPERYNLRKLCLQGNRIKIIEKHHFGTGTIYRLDLSDNCDVIIAEDLFEHVLVIKSLNLSGISYFKQKLPNFQHLKHLQELFLSSNQIYRFPNLLFVHLNYLQLLDLDNNNLGNLKLNVSETGCKTNLNTLYLNTLRQKVLKYPLFAVFNNVTSLSLRKCEIYFISSTVFRPLLFLEHLFLSYNMIKTLDNRMFNNLLSLKSLYLDHNRLVDFEFNPFLNNDKLRTLNLVSNRISNVKKEYFINTRALISERVFSTEENYCSFRSVIAIELGSITLIYTNSLKAQSGRNKISLSEWLDLGNNKKALQESERMLKKVPDFHCAKALKALSLIRLKRNEEALRILHALKSLQLSDEYSLQAMTFCFLEIKQFNEICIIYEKAVDKEKNNEELYSHLFMSYVRTFDFKSQKKIAMFLYKLKQKNSYYYWSVMSILLEAIYNEANDRSKQIILLNLAKKMMDKILDEQLYFEAVPELQMYFWILRSLNKFDEILRCLNNKKFLGELLNNEQLEYKFESLMMLEKWMDLNNLCKEVLQNDMDKWNVWKLYFKSSLQLIKMNRNKSNSGNMNKHRYCDQTFERMHDFINSLIRRMNEKKRKVRGPFLARLELYKHMVEMKEDPKKIFVSVEDLIMNYLVHFGDKLCATSDLKSFFQLIRNDDDRVNFCLEVLSLCRLDTEDFDSIDQLRIYSTSLQILRLCGYHTYKDSLNRWDSFADTAYESYRRSAVQANKENSPIKDRESIDMFGLLAAHYYYDFAIEHKSIQPLLTSLNILHEILNDNCHNYHAKLLCIKLYHFLGSAEVAHKFYKSLDVKQIQLDSLAYIHCIPSSQYGMLKTTNQIYENTLNFFNGSDLDCIDQITYAYKYGSFLKINEFIEFRDKLRNSFNYFRVSVNKFFLQIVLCCHIDHLANISTVPVSFDVDKLVDNQDYDVFTHWNAMARQQGYQQIKERVHAENVELMKVRYDLLKLIEILIHIYKTDPDADLSVFVDQLKSAKNTWIQSLREFRTIQPIQVYKHISLFLPSNIEVVQRSPCDLFMVLIVDYFCDLIGPQNDSSAEEIVKKCKDIVEKLIKQLELVPIRVNELLNEPELQNNINSDYLSFWTVRIRHYAFLDIIEILSLIIFAMQVYRNVVTRKKSDPNKKNRKKTPNPKIEPFLTLISALQKCFTHILSSLEKWKFACNKLVTQLAMNKLSLQSASATTTTTTKTEPKTKGPTSTATATATATTSSSEATTTTTTADEEVSPADLPVDEILHNLTMNRLETIDEFVILIKDKTKMLNKMAVLS